MLSRFTDVYSSLKMECVAFIHCLQGLLKQFPCIIVYGKKSFAIYLVMLYYLKHNEIDMHYWCAIKQFLLIMKRIALINNLLGYTKEFRYIITHGVPLYLTRAKNSHTLFINIVECRYLHKNILQHIRLIRTTRCWN